MKRARVAVLISGRGSNFKALAKAAQSADYPAELAVVISNRADAAGLSFAAEHSIPTRIIDHTHYDGRAAFDAALADALRTAEVELLCLAGFMRLLTPAFVTAWQGRMINIHPSLLPSFKGLHPQRQALEAGALISGCTVHFVVPEMDAGPPILQCAVPVHPDDDEARLSARILEAEHRTYPAALAQLARGAVRLSDGRAVFSSVPTRDSGTARLESPAAMFE